MNYKEIDYDLNPIITGCKEGGSQAWFGKYKISNEDKIMEFIFNSGKKRVQERHYFPDFPLEILGLEMENSAKLTDFIYAPPLRFIISDRLRKVISDAKDLKLPKYEFFPVAFQKKKVYVDNYWWFCFEPLFGDEVNFQKSELETGSYSDFGINNSEDYLKFDKRNVVKFPLPKVLHFKHKLDYDILDLGIFTGRILASEKFINLLNEAKATGYKVYEPTVQFVGL